MIHSSPPDQSTGAGTATRSIFRHIDHRRWTTPTGVRALADPLFELVGPLLAEAVGLRRADGLPYAIGTRGCPTLNLGEPVPRMEARQTRLDG